jgi:hypothetical protein
MNPWFFNFFLGRGQPQITETADTESTDTTVHLYLIYQLRTHSYSRTPHLHCPPPKRQYLNLLLVTNHTDTTATLSRPFVQTLGGTPATVAHSREILVISTWIKP